MATFNDLEAALKIDKYNLDDDNLLSPQLMWDATKQLASARAALGLAELDVKTAVAELDKTLREDLSEQGEKLSEAKLTRLIESSPVIRKAKIIVIKTQETVDQWEGMVESLKQRSYALKLIQELHIANYYSTESGGKQRSETTDRIAEHNRKEAGRLSRDDDWRKRRKGTT